MWHDLVLLFLTGLVVKYQAVVVRDYNRVDYRHFDTLQELKSVYFPHDMASINVFP